VLIPGLLSLAWCVAAGPALAPAGEGTDQPLPALPADRVQLVAHWHGHYHEEGFGTPHWKKTIDIWFREERFDDSVLEHPIDKDLRRCIPERLKVTFTRDAVYKAQDPGTEAAAVIEEEAVRFEKELTEKEMRLPAEDSEVAYLHGLQNQLDDGMKQLRAAENWENAMDGDPAAHRDVMKCWDRVDTLTRQTQQWVFQMNKFNVKVEVKYHTDPRTGKTQAQPSVTIGNIPELKYSLFYWKLKLNKVGKHLVWQHQDNTPVEQVQPPSFGFTFFVTDELSPILTKKVVDGPANKPNRVCTITFIRTLPKGGKTPPPFGRPDILLPNGILAKDIDQFIKQLNGRTDKTGSNVDRDANTLRPKP
jgi:hypothetical protein